ncbi:unnamed protein product [Prunus armeniaca]|uniref:Uncharacterized protein n=1 Tax=Prunus armeniaca TaxID=36596 RepID=A0A6J5X2R7_PRUAR|nr:unnamed protein product [Prunus armeniaca]
MYLKKIIGALVLDIDIDQITAATIHCVAQVGGPEVETTIVAHVDGAPGESIEAVMSQGRSSQFCNSAGGGGGGCWGWGGGSGFRFGFAL